MTALSQVAQPLTVVLMLTPKEQEVLRLVADGDSAKEVAIKMGIAPRTVEAKIERLRLKTRSRNRTHLISNAIQQGLI